MSQLQKGEIAGEYIVPPSMGGEEACKQLAEHAPAFMIHNGTRVDAYRGESSDEINWRLQYVQLSIGAAHGDGRCREMIEIMNRRPVGDR